MFDAILVDGAKILEVSLHGVKRKRGGVGGGGGAVPPFANTFITGSEGVHMGFVFVARMIAAACCSDLAQLKNDVGVLAGTQPLICKRTACMMT